MRLVHEWVHNPWLLVLLCIWAAQGAAATLQAATDLQAGQQLKPQARQLLQGQSWAPVRARLLQDAQTQEVPSSERQALLRLFNATNGPGWNISQPWSQGGPVCSWPGVSCCMAVPAQARGGDAKPDVGYFLWVSPNDPAVDLQGYQASTRHQNEPNWNVQACDSIGSVAAITPSGFNLVGVLPDNVLNSLPGLHVLDLSNNPGLLGGGPNLVSLLYKLAASNLINTQLACGSMVYPATPHPKSLLSHKEGSAGSSSAELIQQGWSALTVPPACQPPASLLRIGWTDVTLSTKDQRVLCSSLLTENPLLVGQFMPNMTSRTDPAFWQYQTCVCDEPSYVSRFTKAGAVVTMTQGHLPTVLVSPDGMDVLLVCPNANWGASRKGMPAAYVAAVIVGGILLCTLAFGFMLWRRYHKRRATHKKAWRSERHIPPGTRPDLFSDSVSLVATDVEGSTELWEWEPQVMNSALALHDTLMRATIAACGGYEVTTEGDAFLVAWHTPVAAVRWCLMLQQGLLKIAWPSKLLEHRLCCARPLILVAPPFDELSPGKPAEAAEPQLLTLFQGLNVRMGVATGVPSSVLPHPTTGRMQYNGLVLRLATAVADMALGGQVLLEPCTFRALHGTLSQLHVEASEVQDITDHVNSAAASTYQRHDSECRPASDQASSENTTPNNGLLRCQSDKRSLDASTTALSLANASQSQGASGALPRIDLSRNPSRGSSMLPNSKTLPRRLPSRLELTISTGMIGDELGLGIPFSDQRQRRPSAHGPDSQQTLLSTYQARHYGVPRVGDFPYQGTLSIDAGNEVLMTGEQVLNTLDMSKMSSIMALFSKSVFLSQAGPTPASGYNLSSSAVPGTSTTPPTTLTGTLNAWPQPADQVQYLAKLTERGMRQDLPSLPEDDPESLASASRAVTARSNTAEGELALSSQSSVQLPGLARRTVSFQLTRFHPFEDGALNSKPSSTTAEQLRKLQEGTSMADQQEGSGPRRAKPRAKTFYHVRPNRIAETGDHVPGDPQLARPKLSLQIQPRSRIAEEPAVAPVRLHSARSKRTDSTELTGDRLRKAGSKGVAPTSPAASIRSSVQKSWLLDQLNAARSIDKPPALSNDTLHGLTEQSSAAETAIARTASSTHAPTAAAAPSFTLMNQGTSMSVWPQPTPAHLPVNQVSHTGTVPALTNPPSVSQPEPTLQPTMSQTAASNASVLVNNFEAISMQKDVSQDLLFSTRLPGPPSWAGRASSNLPSIGSIIIPTEDRSTNDHQSSNSHGPRSRGTRSSWSFQTGSRPAADAGQEHTASTPGMQLTPISESASLDRGTAAQSTGGPVAEGLESGMDDLARSAASRPTAEHVRCSANRLSRFAVEPSPAQQRARRASSVWQPTSPDQVPGSQTRLVVQRERDAQPAPDLSAAQHRQRAPVKRSSSSPLLGPGPLDTTIKPLSFARQRAEVASQSSGPAGRQPPSSQVVNSSRVHGQVLGSTSDSYRPVHVSSAGSIPSDSGFSFKSSGEKITIRSERISSHNGCNRSNTGTARRMVLNFEAQEKHSLICLPSNAGQSGAGSASSSRRASQRLDLANAPCSKSDLLSTNLAQSLNQVLASLGSRSGAPSDSAEVGPSANKEDTRPSQPDAQRISAVPQQSVSSILVDQSTRLTALSKETVRSAVKRRSSWIMANLTNKPAPQRDPSFSGKDRSSSSTVFSGVSETPRHELQRVMVIDMGVHLIKSLGPALPQDLVHGLQVVQILPEALSARASYLNHVQSKKMIAPSFFDAPGANLALAPRAAGNPSVKLPPVVVMFISAEHLGSVVDSTDQSVYDQSLALFCHTVRSVLQEFQLYECQESQGCLMVVAPEPCAAVEAALLLQLKLLNVDWPESLLDLDVAEEVREPQTGRLLFRGLRAKIGIRMDTPLSIVPHTTTGRADYFGTLVNRAARYMAGAAGGQVLVDSAVAGLVTNGWRIKAANMNDTVRSGMLFSSTRQRTCGTDTDFMHALKGGSTMASTASSLPKPAAQPVGAEATVDAVVPVYLPGGHSMAASSQSKLLDSFGLLSEALGESPVAESTAILLVSYPALSMVPDGIEYTAFAPICMTSANPSNASLPATTIGNKTNYSKQASKGTSLGATSPTVGSFKYEVQVLDLGEYEFNGLSAPQAVMGFQLVQLAGRSQLLRSTGLPSGKARCIRPGIGMVDTCIVSL